MWPRPSQEIAKAAGSGSSSSGSRSAVSYDYSGQDIAHKKADELSQLDAQRQASLVDDPLGAVAIGRRIRDLQGYLAAYRTGAPGAIPGVRIASQSSDENAEGKSGGEMEWYQTPAITESPAKKQGS
jgi:hypothetical protein